MTARDEKITQYKQDSQPNNVRSLKFQARQNKCKYDGKKLCTVKRK